MSRPTHVPLSPTSFPLFVCLSLNLGCSPSHRTDRRPDLHRPALSGNELRPRSSRSFSFGTNVGTPRETRRKEGTNRGSSRKEETEKEAKKNGVRERGKGRRDQELDSRPLFVLCSGYAGVVAWPTAICACHCAWNWSTRYSVGEASEASKVPGTCVQQSYALCGETRHTMVLLFFVPLQPSGTWRLGARRKEMLEILELLETPVDRSTALFGGQKKRQKS